jgi:hypothetical protein
VRKGKPKVDQEGGYCRTLGMGLSIVVHNYNPNYAGGRGRRITS